jgi:hypothetical protein
VITSQFAGHNQWGTQRAAREQDSIGVVPGPGGGSLACQNVTFFVSHKTFNQTSQMRVVSRDEQKVSDIRCLLFSKSETTLLKGSSIEMLQWSASALNATRRAVAAANDLEATMQAECVLMKRWLQQSH